MKTKKTITAICAGLMGVFEELLSDADVELEK